MQPVSLVVKKEYGSSETATWQVDGLIVGRLDVDWKLVTKESDLEFAGFKGGDAPLLDF